MAQDWNWTIRDAVGDDLHFIYTTWMNSLWTDSERGSGFTKTTFWSEYLKVIDHILTLEDTRIVVACDGNDPMVIFGYLVTQPEKTHYAFVKSMFRKVGVAKALFIYAKCKPVITHRTEKMAAVMKTHPELHYNPFLLYHQKGNTHGSAQAS